MMRKKYRGLFWEEFQIAQEFVSPGRTVTEADTNLFAGLSGDFNPLHMDEEFASRSPFGKRIAHGALVQSIMTGLISQLGIFEGTTVALRQLSSRFKGPAYFGDTLFATIQVAEKKDLRGRTEGLIVFDTQVANQEEKVLSKGTWTVVIRKRPS